MDINSDITGLTTPSALIVIMSDEASGVIAKKRIKEQRDKSALFFIEKIISL
jgi:hypothetical protein